jgi:hypothetical protein
MDKIEVIIMGVLLISSLCVLVYCAVYNEVVIIHEQCEELECEIQEIIYDKHTFTRIASNLAFERRYNIDSYNCVDYSRELKRRLEQAGYDAEFKSGYIYDKKMNGSKYAHAWVEVKVLIEATNGKIVKVEDYGRYDERSFGII